MTMEYKFIFRASTHCSSRNKVYSLLLFNFWQYHSRILFTELVVCKTLVTQPTRTGMILTLSVMAIG